MFVRQKKTGKYTYLQICESRWEDGRSRQRVIATLGRAEHLADGGEIEGLMRALQRYTDRALVVSEHAQGQLESVQTRSWGPALVFERLWRESGIASCIERVAKGRKFRFALERAIFLTVLHRLFAPGSDRAAERWKSGFVLEGADGLQLHQLYRAMAWLGEPLADDAQGGSTGFSPRCTKDRIEETLFLEGRTLFSPRNLDLVFFDTTSLYFEGAGGESLGRRGHSKDRMPDHNQVVVGVVMDSDANPICCEVWPGNTADVSTLVPVADRLRERFGIGRVCVVADRGMISKNTIRELDDRGWLYILGARMRSQKEVRDEVLSRAGRFRKIREGGASTGAPEPLSVKDVHVDGRRYVLCRNEAQAKKDAGDRKAILASLEDQLRGGPRKFIGNRGYRRFLRIDGGKMAIDKAAVKREARYDGKWVLRTNTDLDAGEVALRYKQLLEVEAVFRTMKSTLDTRPIYHQSDAAIRGHVFCSFLALRLRKELADRLEAKGLKLEWGDILRDLERVTETIVEREGCRFALRSQLTGVSGKVLQATGVAPPRTVRQLSPPQPRS